MVRSPRKFARLSGAARLAAAACVALAAVGGPAMAEDVAQGWSFFGVWRNPQDSVHVQIRPCGAGACGYVVWATANAQADARKGGTKNLVGVQVFRDLVRVRDGVWKGKVFVPDLNATFTGRTEAMDANTMRAKGCLIGAILCKWQVWTRVGQAG